MATEVANVVQCLPDASCPRFFTGEKRSNFGIRLFVENTTPPGTMLATTIASGTPSNGSTIFTSSTAAPLHTTDIAFSTAPAAPSGAYTRRNSDRNESR